MSLASPYNQGSAGGNTNSSNCDQSIMMKQTSPSAYTEVSSECSSSSSTVPQQLHSINNVSSSSSSSSSSSMVSAVSSSKTSAAYSPLYGGDHQLTPTSASASWTSASPYSSSSYSMSPYHHHHPHHPHHQTHHQTAGEMQQAAAYAPVQDQCCSPSAASPHSGTSGHSPGGHHGGHGPSPVLASLNTVVAPGAPHQSLPPPQQQPSHHSPRTMHTLQNSSKNGQPSEVGGIVLSPSPTNSDQIQHQQQQHHHHHQQHHHQPSAPPQQQQPQSQAATTAAQRIRRPMNASWSGRNTSESDWPTRILTCTMCKGMSVDGHSRSSCHPLHSTTIATTALA
ncbi:hypothetical protein TYRP_002409 [Tyrophagus putrescentiae]|nr:hypothetical protein TYRP_002409 [Tyrophagus putrescentiae]